MRTINALALCSLLCSPVFAQGQRPATDVNVINSPGVTVENTAKVNVDNETSNPVPVNIVESSLGASALTEYQIVGLTMAALPGAVSTVDANGDILRGVRAMNHLCKSQVADNARAASVEDLQHTADIDDPVPPDGAWITASNLRVVYRPDLVPPAWSAYETTNSNVAGLGSSPHDALRDTTCASWSSASSSDNGIVISSSGEVALGACGVARRIACSAPVLMPVTP